MSLSEERTDDSASVEYQVSKPSMLAGASRSTVPPEMSQEDIIVKDYLRKKDRLFRDLDDLQEEVSFNLLQLLSLTLIVDQAQSSRRQAFQ